MLKIILLTQKSNISEINQHMKSDKIFQIIYADIEPSTKKVDNCKKNPKKSLTTKVGKHILWEYFISTLLGHLII